MYCSSATKWNCRNKLTYYKKVERLIDYCVTRHSTSQLSQRYCENYNELRSAVDSRFKNDSLEIYRRK